MTEEEILEEYRKCMESFDYWKNKYIAHKRTRDDWQEIVRAISKEKDISLGQALDLYKEDRDKYVDWFNEKIEKRD